MIRINYIRSSGLNFSGGQVAAMLLNIGNEGTHYTNSKLVTLNLYAFINHKKKSKCRCSSAIIRPMIVHTLSIIADSFEVNFQRKRPTRRRKQQ
jgi:hypothetical protein